MIAFRTRSSFRVFAGSIVLASIGAGCSPTATSTDTDPVQLEPRAIDAASAELPSTAGRPDPVQHPAPVIRVGGLDIPGATRDGESWRWERCAITTPLPDGYPPPTPPGAIELKQYPAARRAQVSGTVDPDLGMNAGFFPLFRHIQRRGIAMTSPVEMDYQGVQPGDPAAKPETWTMAFLYREPSLGRTGPDGSVAVVDAPPITVLSIGVRGNYSLRRMSPLMRDLEDWLAANPGWTLAGDARALYYNGPEVRAENRWSELQVPVRPTAGAESREW